MATAKKKRKTTSSGRKTSGRNTRGRTAAGGMGREIGILVLLIICLLLFLSDLRLMGQMGAVLRTVQFGLAGLAAWALPFYIFFVSVYIMANCRSRLKGALTRVALTFLILLCVCGLIQLFSGDMPAVNRPAAYYALGTEGTGGGFFGGLLCSVFYPLVGRLGTYIILAAGTIACVMVLTGLSLFSSIGRKGADAAAEARLKREKKREQKAIDELQHKAELAQEYEEVRKRRRRIEEEISGLSTRVMHPDQAEDDPGWRRRMAGYNIDLTPEKKRASAAASARSGRNTDESLPGPEESTETAKAPESAAGFFSELFHPRREKRSLSELEELDASVGQDPTRRDRDRKPAQGRKTDEEALPPWETMQIERQDGGSAKPEADTAQTGAGGQLKPHTATEKENRAAGTAAGSAAAGRPERQPAEQKKDTSSDSFWRTGPPSESSSGRRFTEDVKGASEAAAGTYGERAGRMSSGAGTAGGYGAGASDTSAAAAGTSGAAGTVYGSDSAGRTSGTGVRRPASSGPVPEMKPEPRPPKPYVCPSSDLLKMGPRRAGTSDNEIRTTARKLQETLASYGIGVEVTHVSCGPTVTRYELKPAQGVRVSQIQSRADDIKLNLAASEIRIEAPIPGKSAVGIEVPNAENQTVYIKELIDSDEFRRASSKVSFAVGRDISGRIIMADIAKMPHLLIAGATGSGKSVCINTIIMSILYKASPEDVRMVMIDPKVVELSVYNGIPHLLTPVVTDPKKAAGALQWAVTEMTNRYKRFAAHNVRDIQSYNELAEKDKTGSLEKLPKILIIVDELADLMMVAAKDVEASIQRLAQLARAAGLHLILATQRPSVNVITGVIKANVPSRLAFAVSSSVDSRTILDMGGAEKLLGKGDMLLHLAGWPKPVRIQGAYVSDAEIHRVVSFLREQADDDAPEQEPPKELTRSMEGGTEDGEGDGSSRDELFAKSALFLIERGKGTSGSLQRMFRIGFNRAARILDQLTEAGVLGPDEGTKPRQVLMTKEEFLEAFPEEGGWDE